MLDAGYLMLDKKSGVLVDVVDSSLTGAGGH
jgi:hypothetical protein